MSTPVGETPGLPPPAEAAEPRPAARLVSQRLLAAAAVVLLVIVVVVVATMLLPREPAPPKSGPEADFGPRIAALDTALARETAAAQRLDQRVAAVEARPTNTAAVQQLEQRVAALEARPVVDVVPIKQQLVVLSEAIAGLTTRLAALDKQVHAETASDPATVAAVLALLQIREAIEVGRPFAAEYNTLLALAQSRPEIAAAAAALAEAATTGVAGRVALAERLRQLAPQIATAAAPESEPGWRSEVKTQLQSLVTIRRVDGPGQSPAEAAVATAQRDVAGGDLAGAVAALGELGGANAAAAEPWLKMARQRLQVETALRRVETLAAAQLAAGAAQGVAVQTAPAANPAPAETGH
jgi:hypothetical protein